MTQDMDELKEKCNNSTNGVHIFPSESTSIGNGRYVKTCIACGKIEEVDMTRILRANLNTTDHE